MKDKINFDEEILAIIKLHLNITDDVCDKEMLEEINEFVKKFSSD